MPCSMTNNQARILCIGKDPGLLRSRCAVLAHGGYDAQAVMFADAERLLREGSFDLVILSAILNDEERRQIGAQVGDPARIMILKKLIFASELLAEVERRLLKTRQDSFA
jgi:hypothetical protein